MTDISIASVVTVPDEAESSTQPLKRRRSDVAEQEQESKRQRVSPGKNSPTAVRDEATSRPSSKAGQSREVDPLDSHEARRKSGVADEKQRSKRLFGALLGNLKQPSDRTSKRRQEIESRRKAELQRQDDERVEDKLRRQEKLVEQRKKSQVKVDEQDMRIRHASLLNTANFLQTVAEPTIYYRPWDLRPDEETRIEEQLKEAQARVDQELDEFDLKQDQANQSRRDVDTKEALIVTSQTNPEHKSHIAAETSPEHESVSASDSKMDHAEDTAPAKSTNDEDFKPAEVPESDNANADTNDALPTAEGRTDEELKNENAEPAEDEGGHVVDGDEDTVIY